MKNGRKLLLTSILLASSMLGGCSQKDFNDLFAPDRRLPDGSETTFENRRSPMLNPDPGSHGIKKVPVENGASAAAPVVAMTSQESGIPQLKTENIYPAIQKSPVVPVASGEIPPASAYPSLSNVPPTPVKTPPGQIKEGFASLSSQQTNMESDRKNLMDNKDATLFTSGKIPSGNPSPMADLTVPPVNAADESPKDARKKSLKSVSEVQSRDTKAKILKDTTISERKVPSENASLLPEPPSSSSAPRADVIAPPAAVASSETQTGDTAFGSWLHTTFTQKKSDTASSISPAVPKSSETNKIFSDSFSDSKQAGFTAIPSFELPAPGKAMAKTESVEIVKPLPATDSMKSGQQQDSSWLGNLFNTSRSSATNSRPSANTPKDTIFDTQAKETPAPREIPVEFKPLPEVSVKNPPARIAVAPSPAPVANVPPETPASVADNNLPDISKMQEKEARRVNLVQPSNYSTSPAGYGYIEESRYDKHASDEN